MHHSQAGLDETQTHSRLTITLKEVSVSGPTFDEVLNDIKSFITNHRELVILKMSHYLKKTTNQANQNFTASDYQELVGKITNSLAPWLYTNSLPAGTHLADITLNEYLSRPTNGTVMVVCDGDYPINHPTPGIWAYEDYNDGSSADSALRVFDVYSNTMDYEEMRTDQLAKFENYGATALTDSCGLFLMSWTLTGDGSVSISDLAEDANPHLSSEMAALTIPNAQSRIPNLLYVDFVETALVTDVAVYLNSQPYPPWLWIDCQENNIQLDLEAMLGEEVQIEQTSDLTSPDWNPAMTVTVTNGLQRILSIPSPADHTSFWRVNSE